MSPGKEGERGRAKILLSVVLGCVSTAWAKGRHSKDRRARGSAWWWRGCGQVQHIPARGRRGDSTSNRPARRRLRRAWAGCQTGQNHGGLW
ncbi:hypothetical protein BU26DRAFT_298056 [Trematosphaeria pertusa]|uniref:Secreted protein n=1 Tax=Trematosphaeria pertusa TaxID=390896 RepID=A0A6A6IL33_9PLEO|nr:uncharacterized protein BU26DRAFT_298056 [Trematosphaeria pertusa]KAF2250250.1 hypothetical protein BU26DRAFT_298056 [Trematosphaeria pertusa]